MLVVGSDQAGAVTMHSDSVKVSASVRDQGKWGDDDDVINPVVGKDNGGVRSLP